MFGLPVVVGFVLWRHIVLKRRMGELRGEMAEVQRNRLAVEVALSNAATGTAAKPDTDSR
jgi:hypothetical protein